MNTVDEVLRASYSFCSVEVAQVCENALYTIIFLESR